MDQGRMISVNGLVAKFKSKDDIYKRFTVDRKNISPSLFITLVQYFLLSKKMCPHGFIRDIIRGKKIVCPRYSEWHRH